MAEPARPTRHPRRVLTTVLLVLALVAAGFAAVGVLAYCSLLGCTLFSEDFEPHGREATAARAEAAAGTAGLADRLVAGREVLATATADGCSSGQNNWKRKDTYSHECEVVDSRVVLVTTDADAVADGLTAADAALRGLGCAPVSVRGGLDRVREEYWDPANPMVRQHGAAGLPGATYGCPDGRTVVAQPTSDRAPADPGVALGSTYPDDEISSSWYTAADVAALRRSGARLALVLRVQQPYYRTRF